MGPVDELKTVFGVALHPGLSGKRLKAHSVALGNQYGMK
jgi:hypothetical protein